MRQKLVSMQYLKRNLRCWIDSIDKRAALSLDRRATNEEIALGIVEILEHDGNLDGISIKEIFNHAIN